MIPQNGMQRMASETDATRLADFLSRVRHDLDSLKQAISGAAIRINVESGGIDPQVIEQILSLIHI